MKAVLKTNHGLIEEHVNLEDIHIQDDHGESVSLADLIKAIWINLEALHLELPNLRARTVEISSKGENSLF